MASIYSDNVNNVFPAFHALKIGLSNTSSKTKTLLPADVFVASYLASDQRIDGNIHLVVDTKMCDFMTDEQVPAVVDSIIKAAQDGAATVHTISIRNHRVANAGAASLAKLIPKTVFEEGEEKLEGTHNVGLEVLDLGGNDIEAEGCKAICEAISKNNKLRELNLSHNPLGRNGGYAVAEMLEENVGLTNLNCGSADLRMDNVIAIMSVMRRNEMIERLFISNCRTFSLQEDLAAQTTRMLEFNSTLVELNFESNNVGDEGAVLFASVLERKNTTLRVLSLATNHIGVRGAEALASSLMRRTNLVSLSLSNNRIGNEGAKAFGAALARINTLKSLDLRYNSVGDEGLVEVAYGVQENSSLSELKLWGNDFQMGVASEFLGLLQNRFSYFGVCDLISGRS
ncbi:hypothetical protein ScalyP_jg10355 [Parmales sp. scaly parma]|nr:hypothetical protein ScalyP_jg10355 [Parmales sp. scaly parma]